MSCIHQSFESRSTFFNHVAGGCILSMATEHDDTDSDAGSSTSSHFVLFPPNTRTPPLLLLQLASAAVYDTDDARLPPPPAHEQKLGAYFLSLTHPQSLSSSQKLPCCRCRCRRRVAPSLFTPAPPRPPRNTRTPDSSIHSFTHHQNSWWPTASAVVRMPSTRNGCALACWCDLVWSIGGQVAD